MKECPKCNVLHEKLGLFCSRSCANSRQWSEETNNKRSQLLKGRVSKKTTSNIDKWRESLRKTRLEKYNATPFDELGNENKRRRVFERRDF